jgi:hypothetical protein
VLLVLDGISSSDGPGLSGIALIVSTYIGGRCLIKAAQAWRAGASHLNAPARRGELHPTADDVEDQIDAALRRKDHHHR